MIKAFLLCLLPLFLYGEPFWEKKINGSSVAVEISSKTLSLNQSLKLSVYLEYTGQAKPQIPTAWLQDELSAFALRSKETKESAHSTIVEYTLEPLFAGDVFIRIPPITLQNATFTVPLIPISITPLSEASRALTMEPLVRTDTLYPIEISRENARHFEKPATPEEMVALFHQRTFPLGTLLLAMTTIFALLFLLHWLKRQTPIPIEDSRVKLLKTLRDLEISLSKNQLEPGVYQTLNMRMRQYIQEKYGINAPYQTTEEFLEKASNSPDIDLKKREYLKAFLKESDRVKFKGRFPSLQDLDASLKLVHKLISNS